MENVFGDGCPTCGDLAVDLGRAGDVVTMRCVDAACAREFEVTRSTGSRDRASVG